jgi:hypothetical protein
MLKERTKKQLLLPFYIIEELCDDASDKTSKRMNNYILAIKKRYSNDKLNQILTHKKDCFFHDLSGLELKKPPITKNREILKKFYEEHFKIKEKAKQSKYSGYKVLRIMFHYVTSIFSEYEDSFLKNKEQIKLLYSLQKLLNYALYYEHKERYKKLDTEEDYEKFDSSAKKQSLKYFQKYYTNL